MFKLIRFFLFIFVLQTNYVWANCTDPVNCLGEISNAEKQFNNQSHCPEMDDAGNPENITEKKEKRIKDPNGWKYALTGTLLAPVAFIAGNAIHEGTHCLSAMKIEGMNCEDLIIIPSYDEERNYFYFGYTNVSFDEENPPTYDSYALFSATPMFVNASLISAYSTLAFTDNLPKNKWAKTGVLLLGATQVIDMANHARNFGAYSDSSKVIAYLQVEKGLSPIESILAVKGPQIGFTLLGAGALALEGYRLMTVPKKEIKKEQIHIIPTVTKDSVNIGIQGNF